MKVKELKNILAQCDPEAKIACRPLPGLPTPSADGLKLVTKPGLWISYGIFLDKGQGAYPKWKSLCSAIFDEDELTGENPVKTH
jgi:hypothetical protein